MIAATSWNADSSFLIGDRTRLIPPLTNMRVFSMLDPSCEIYFILELLVCYNTTTGALNHIKHDGLH